MGTDASQNRCQAQADEVSGDATVDLVKLRAQLAQAAGPRFWRSLEELAGTRSFHQVLHREFPRNATEWRDGPSRRDFLALAAASLSLAGVTGCTRQPLEQIVPYVRQPEEILPGKPLFYTTALALGDVALPVLVRSDMGRPNKVEGNFEHPASLGGTDIYSQAAILDLYDPDRSQTCVAEGDVQPFAAFITAVRNRLIAQRALGGAGLRFLTQTVNSPTLAAQLKGILQLFPQARWHQWEPVNRDNARAGQQMAFGRHVDAVYRLAEAEVVVTLDAELLASTAGPRYVRYAREYAVRRKLGLPQAAQDAQLGIDAGRGMSRWYAIESTPTNTGAKADHRLPLRATEIESLARALAGALGVSGAGAAANSPHAPWIAALARDLQQHRGACVIVPGEFQTPNVHALAHAMNAVLGNVGKTVVYIEPVDANPVDHLQSLRELVNDMRAGRVDTLMILGGNPVYDTPRDVGFKETLYSVPFRAHLSVYQDETSALCHWHVPQAHALESWGDARAYDGTVTICQPLIAPLYEGRSAHEVVAAFSDNPLQSGYEAVRSYWQAQRGGGATMRPHAGANAAGTAARAAQLESAAAAEGAAPAVADTEFERFWRRTLHDGFMASSASAPVAVSARALNLQPEPAPQAGVEVIFRPDPSIYDGRFANNGWLQELPRPLFHITWENAALLSPAMAERLKVSSEQVLDLKYQGFDVRAPVYVLPGHPDNSVTVHLGYGRSRSGHTGTDIGYNAYAIRTSKALWFGSGLEYGISSDRVSLADTRDYSHMEGRDLVRVATLDEYRRQPNFARRDYAPGPNVSLFPKQFQYTGYGWGMAIDLNSCVGCNACVIACQAENNIPVIGKREVTRGREMHWLRIDRYYEGDWTNPATYFEPVPCMHCENAPCELVCPVQATVHSSEGLNDMVYNRCVGTRYCSNNCPYKVRRFNFLLYQDFTTPSLKGMRNPDVTVRSRGVMEKCTYCVQRINRARVQSEKEDRLIRDDELQTACQQACPADAIVFGNINDANSRVAKLKDNSRNYGLLAELGTRPRTTYLASVRNPNPEIAGTRQGSV